LQNHLQIDDRDSRLGAAFSRDNVLWFQSPCRSKALWQLVNSVVPYVFLWIAMVYALEVSYWLVVPLAILAAGFLTRIFIIFHDCGHGSFFKSKCANEVTGTIPDLDSIPSLALATWVAPWHFW
jgi:fatty acid desaturase